MIDKHGSFWYYIAAYEEVGVVKQNRDVLNPRVD